jgi:hypothetical protein
MTRRILIGLAAIGAVLISSATPASADPITCPPGQSSQQVSPGVWSCVNHGGNTDNSADPRNPNQ